MSRRNKDKYSSEFEEHCKGYTNIPDTLSRRDRIIAIGDVHGDLNLTVRNLVIAKVIEITDKGKDTLEVIYEDKSKEYFKWIGEDTVVVQVGDQVDRCRPVGFGTLCVRDKEATVDDEHSDIKILDLFTELNKLAKKKGGMVISLLGNHELMNYQGNMNYVSYKGIHNDDFEGPNAKYKNKDGSTFKDGVEGRKYAFKEALNEKLACTRQSAVIVGSFIFVHGGIVPELAKKYKVGEINTLIRKWLLKKIDDDNPDIDTIINTPYESPFWSRLFGHLPSGLPFTDSRCEDSLIDIFTTWGDGKKGLKGMVIGHTPQIEKGINSTCGDKVWRVDIGASKAFDVFDKIKNSGRKPSVLEIKGDGKEFNILS
jgi:hypothetical protein